MSDGGTAKRFNGLLNDATDDGQSAMKVKNQK